jgi:hypothetical protein
MNKTTVQISVYNWVRMEEYVYETQVRSLGDFLALTYRYDKRVKYKKASDKNWYYAKTMVKRLFKNELGADGLVIKFVTSNDLKKMEEEKQKKKEEARLKEEKERQALKQWEEANTDITFEQINSMSNNDLANRLVSLYIENYLSRKYEYVDYRGPFNCCLTEIAFIEQKVSSCKADDAYYKSCEILYGGNSKQNRLPVSEFFKLTDEYELIYIGRAS